MSDFEVLVDLYTCIYRLFTYQEKLAASAVELCYVRYLGRLWKANVVAIITKFKIELRPLPTSYQRQVDCNTVPVKLFENGCQIVNKNLQQLM